MDTKINKWTQKQCHALPGYIEAVEHKNFVFDSIAIEFGRFCNLDGLILDVGCGIRPDLAYATYLENTTFIGIDPFIEYKRNFEFIGGVGEQLPFKSNKFNHVIFATSLDHVVNPLAVLIEARRVLDKNGKLSIWSSCFDWYERFRERKRVKALNLFLWSFDFYVRKKDEFHFSHFTTSKIMSLLDEAGFVLLRFEKVLSDTSTSISVFFQGEK